jgi:hypothetical protein
MFGVSSGLWAAGYATYHVFVTRTLPQRFNVSFRRAVQIDMADLIIGAIDSAPQ